MHAAQPDSKSDVTFKHSGGFYLAALFTASHHLKLAIVNVLRGFFWRNANCSSNNNIAKKKIAEQHFICDCSLQAAAFIY